MHGEVRVVDDVASAFAELVSARFDARAKADQFSLALSGGSTARPAYEALAKQHSIDWSKVVVLWGDERLVPLDHEDSNYLLAEQSLLSHIDKPSAVHPMYNEGGADAYDELVKSLTPIDVVHLGMGDDGHTASLFPGSPDLRTPQGRLVVKTGDDLHKHERLTFTYEAINQSSLVIFTVVGAAKREMFSKISAGEDFPVSHVDAKETIWLVDAAAAG